MEDREDPNNEAEWKLEKLGVRAYY